METFDGRNRCFDISAQRSNECVRLIRKLRWIGHVQRSRAGIGTIKRVAVPAQRNRNCRPVGDGLASYRPPFDTCQ
jgi:hypothetical protein